MSINEKYELAIVNGDLSKLTTEEKLSYYINLCDSLKLNRLTKPFEYISLNGRLQLYATKTATDQLRAIHKVSLRVVDRQLINDCYSVTVQASLPDGRIDETTGVVFLGKSQGDQYANAIMKAETKAKRRATLSICGLGFIDESELETIPTAKKEKVVEEELKKVEVIKYTFAEAKEKIDKLINEKSSIDKIKTAIQKGYDNNKIDDATGVLLDEYIANNFKIEGEIYVSNM